jgi:transglutaminase-like putative cysteine protease
MRLDFAFRLSTYLTLGCATACLAYAEDKYVPGVGLFGVAVGVLLVTAFFTDRRWALQTRAANILGALIAAGAGLWVASRLIFPDTDGDPLRIAPWPAALLPFLGPLLMVLMLAKLIRPKLYADYWMLQVLGLLQVALASAMANDPQDSDMVFGALLLAYVVCAMWWLGLAYLHREQVPTAGPLTRVPWRFLGAGQAVAWLLPAAVAGLVLFLITPRAQSLQQPFVLESSPSAFAATAYADSIDLNLTGQVEVTDEVAFKVVASYDHIGVNERPKQPKTDLESQQRWRGATLNYYDATRARWLRKFPSLRRDAGGNSVEPGDILHPREGERTPAAEKVHFGGLIAVGPGQLVPWVVFGAPEPKHHPVSERFWLNFTLYPKRVHGVFVAEPVLPVHSSIATLPGDQRDDFGSWLWQFDPLDGTPTPIAPPTRGQSVYYYRQFTRTPEEPGVSAADRINREYFNLLRTQQPVPRIKDWTAGLLRRFVAERRYGLTARDLPSDFHGLLPEKWEKVARALTTYLSQSGDYGYTLDLRRQDLALDPVEDFLLNVKQGHCERYATGLTLMLRSQGIPARVVLGYRGLEQQSEGAYVVRQSHAHSWVEALVERPGHKDDTPEYFWLTLDPTPADLSGQSSNRTLRDWWVDGWRRVQVLWRDFVIGYNFDSQASLGVDAWDHMQYFRGVLVGHGQWKEAGAPAGLWCALAAIGALGVALYLRRLRRRRRAGEPGMPLPAVPFYARLLTILSRHLSLTPRVGDTPFEFALAAGPVLHGALADASMAAFPARVVELFYRIRYGMIHVGDSEVQAVDRQLDELERLLAVRAREGGKT